MTKQLIYEAGYYDRSGDRHTIGHFTTAESMMNFLHGYAKYCIEDATEYCGDAEAKEEKDRWEDFLEWSTHRNIEELKEGQGICANSIYIDRIALITSFTKEDI